MDMRRQAIMGVVPPQVAEARITVRWPSVAAYPAPARLGAAMQTTANALYRAVLKLHPILAGLLLIPVVPLCFFIALAAWLMLAPFYFIKIMPFLATRYALTNRRVMIQKGISAVPRQYVNLEDITAVRVVPGSEQPFYLAADLEVVSTNGAVLRLAGVKEFASFKAAIENAQLAYGRKSPPTEQIHPAAELLAKK